MKQKLELGGDLFDSACAVALSGIRWQNPGISDDRAWAELRRRLDLGRRLEMRRCSKSCWTKSARTVA